MLFNKKTIVKLVLGTILLVPPFAYADLIINNNTNNDSTSILNNGPCSTIIGVEKGVTRANTINPVPDPLIKKACIASRPARRGQPWICKAEVYMTNNCSGTSIAEVTLDLDKGIQQVVLLNQGQHNFVVTYDKFTASINEVSAIQQTMKGYLSALSKQAS